MKFLLLISALFLTKISFAQTNGATVVLHQDKRVDSLYKALEPKVDRVPKPASQRLVYRLIIDSIKNREYAYQLKAKLTEAYLQQQEVYISYQHPYFKVKLGDFPLKDSAVSFRKIFLRRFKLNTTITTDIQYLMSKI